MPVLHAISARNVEPGKNTKNNLQHNCMH